MTENPKTTTLVIDDETANLVRAEQDRIAEEIGIRSSFRQVAQLLIRRGAAASTISKPEIDS